MNKFARLVVTMGCVDLVAGAACLAAAAPAAAADKTAECTLSSCAVMAPAAAAKQEGVVNTAALMAMMRVKTPMTVLDARTGKFDDGNRLPGAKALAPDATEAQVTAALPDKQALVVTYCANLKCPASHMLGDNLRKLGYANVLEYHEGIEAWMAAGNSVEKAGK